jgi:hypothetical protein
MRDLFRDERPLWDQLAAEHPYLSDDPVIQRELRKEEQANRSKKGSSHATKRPGA